MASLDIRTFQEQVLVGSRVALFLLTGKEIQGRLTVIAENYVTVETDDGSASTWLFEIIAGWLPLSIGPEKGEHQSSSIESFHLDGIGAPQGNVTELPVVENASILSSPMAGTNGTEAAPLLLIGSAQPTPPHLIPVLPSTPANEGDFLKVVATERRLNMQDGLTKLPTPTALSVVQDASDSARQNQRAPVVTEASTQSFETEIGHTEGPSCLEAVQLDAKPIAEKGQGDETNHTETLNQPPKQDAFSGWSVPTFVRVVEKVAEIEARIRANAQNPIVPLLPPEFLLPELLELPVSTKLAIKPHFDRLQNVWSGAHREGDYSRLNSLTRDWEQLAQKHAEQGVFAFNLGCLHLKLEKGEHAFAAFQRAALLTGDSKSNLNLANTALKLGKRGAACYALQEFFRLENAHTHPALWRSCIGLSVELQMLSGMGDHLRSQATRVGESTTELLIETLVFLLKTSQQTEAAYRLSCHLLPGATPVTSLSALIDAEVGALPVTLGREPHPEIQDIFRAKEALLKERTKASEVESLLQEAQDYAQDGKFKQALDIIRKAQLIDPKHAEAARMADECWRQRQRTNVTLPRQHSLYKMAKVAEQQEKDLARAEKYYRRAIAEEDHWRESAIKDLAALLARQGRDDEAVALLRENLSRVENRRALLNLLVTVYQKAGNSTEALKYLRELLNGSSLEEELKILKRIAITQFNLGTYDAAEQTLRNILKKQPGDLEVTRLLEGLLQAKQAARTEDRDALLRKIRAQFAQFETSLTNFLIFHLNRCKYENVRAETLATREFSQRDVDGLDRLAEDFGPSRPRTRAECYLSAAKILQDLGETQELSSLRMRKYLRNFCAAMGDACAAEKKLDVARSYYSEAFLIAPEPDLIPQLQVKLTQTIMSFYAPIENLFRPSPPLHECLDEALSIDGIDVKVVEELLLLSVGEVGAAAFLLAEVFQSEELQEKIIKVCQQLMGQPRTVVPKSNLNKILTKLWEQGRQWAQRRQQEVVNELQVFQTGSLTWDLMEGHMKGLRRLNAKLRTDLDRRRAEDILTILESILDYRSQTDYREQEIRARLVQNRCGEIVKEIEDGPTKLSLEMFHPYLGSLSAFIARHFEQVEVAAEPELTVKLLLEGRYPGDDSPVECQISISNAKGKSPVSAIKITIEDSPDGEYRIVTPSIDLLESLPGNESVACEISVLVTQQVKEAEVFTLYYSLSYATRAGRQVNKTHESLPVRLYPASLFKPFESPYVVGPPIVNPEMFFGRDEFINNLVTLLKSAPSNKSIVIYGQKRSGKSSILFQLDKKLLQMNKASNCPVFIPVYVSIGDIQHNPSFGALLERIAKKLGDKLEDLSEHYPLVLEVSCPTIDEFQQSPQPRLDDFMTKLRRIFTKTDAYQQTRIVLLLDEFGHVYNWIKKGLLPDTFMIGWKAIVERGYFNCVVAGPDIMPKFIAQFPNEFQVAPPQRVGYLSSADARKLIEKPIPTESGESRFRGAAVDKLINLTAGNPFYLQDLCSRFVDYMNDKHAVYVSDVDVRAMLQEYVFKGDRRLAESDFDCLIDPGDGATGISSPEAKQIVLNVLRQVAVGTRHQKYWFRSSAPVHHDYPLDEILDDLVKRDVLEIEGKDRYKIKVGLFKEWLLANE